MRSFERFITIDWTGAKGSRHKAIEVADCAPGDAAPVRVPPPGKYWSRQAVLAFVQDLAREKSRALIGFDFSFAPPFADAGCYLPGFSAPATGPDFWAFVEENSHDEDLGAASLIEGLLRPHFYFGSNCGPKARFLRLRACEAAFNAQGGGKPSSIFDCVGAAQVAKASFAGMRLLHHLREQGVAIWPFDPLPAAGPVVVEIYCRAFLRLAGGRGLKLRDGPSLDAALASLGSRPAGLTGPLPDHLTDVLVSSAGLRHIAASPHVWQPSFLTPELALTEGWTFGVA
ncbi:hypothetical protein [Pedomonas mirosovicensis]|uniref:hypothetical protein n=1 Tax=Pedomonas mirosovicensis TaxID=2908641 RepID=UPI00216A04FB|nr:hypothetical protein [Pedomonas mirosovicensis]MCH8685990.1 hypothetical protein [Pedomonas mirosovicensis]